MTKRKAKQLAYMLIATELRITLGCGTIHNAPDFPAEAEDVRRVEAAIDEIILSLAEKGSV